MKRINNRAFLLIEFLIVTTFVTTIFTFIYHNGLPLMAEYTRRNNYDDIDSVYAVDLFRNLLIEDANFDTIRDGILEGDVIYKDITDCNQWNQVAVCNSLKSELGVTGTQGKIYLTRYELSRLKKEVEEKRIFGNNTDRGIQSYIDFLPRYTTLSVRQGYRIILVRNVETPGGTVQKYSNIEVVL